MAVNTSISLVNLDFDQLVNNFVDYLKSQSAFQDYNFVDSNLRVLIDLLSLNTFQNGFYLNMVASEMFLDSALLPASVYSHVKELGYLPRSARSAKATVNLNFKANTNIVTLPVGTSFTSLVGSNLLTFVTENETVYFSSNNTFSINNLDIYEGKYTSETYVMNYENTQQRFIISDSSVDTRSITVNVIEDNTGTNLIYTFATTTLDQNETSKIFFLQPTETGSFELIFGDNIIGRKPKDGAIIQVNYRVSSAALGNGASRFTLDTEFTTFSASPTVTTVQVSDGGDDPESIDSMKFYAPRYYQIQERAINVNDYEILLKQKFPEIQAISAYGGEEISPPQFGKVFIAVDIADVEGLPTGKVNDYYNYIKPRSPLSIEPVFTVPDFLYYAVNSTVKYDITSTNLAPEQIQSLIVNTIINYNQTNYNDFKSSFKYSKFIANIDAVPNAAILSNDTDIILYKKITPIIGAVQNIDINFDLILTTKGASLGSSYDVGDLVAIQSSPFTYNGETVFIADDNNGNIRIVKTENATNTVVISKIGTVDYNTGLVKLNNFTFDGFFFDMNHIKVYAQSAFKDFDTSKNVILTLESNQININVEAVTDVI